MIVGLAIFFPFAGVVLNFSESPMPADAIVVLAGNAPDRLPWAESLRAAGYAELLVVSNEQVHTHNLQTTWLALHEAGVSAPELPDSSLLVLDNPPPESTLDEARRDADLLAARGARSVLLVTDAFHSRRAWLLFRAALGRKGIAVRSAPVPDTYDLAHWWAHPVTARRVIEEYAKLLYYMPQGAYW